LIDNIVVAPWLILAMTTTKGLTNFLI